MVGKKWFFVAVLVALVVGLAIGLSAGNYVSHTAMAQPPPPGQPGGPGFGPPPGGPGFGPQPGMGEMRPMMPFPMPPGSPAMVAVGDYLYILMGPTLYQYEAKTLKLVKKVRIEEPKPLGPPEGGPGFGPPPGGGPGPLPPK